MAKRQALKDRNHQVPLVKVKKEPVGCDRATNVAKKADDALGTVSRSRRVRIANRKHNVQKFEDAGYIKPDSDAALQQKRQKTADVIVDKTNVQNSADQKINQVIKPGQQETLQKSPGVITQRQNNDLSKGSLVPAVTTKQESAEVSSFANSSARTKQQSPVPDGSNANHDILDQEEEQTQARPNPNFFGQEFKFFKPPCYHMVNHQDYPDRIACRGCNQELKCLIDGHNICYPMDYYFHCFECPSLGEMQQWINCCAACNLIFISVTDCHDHYLHVHGYFPDLN